MKIGKVDLISLEIINNALRSVADEMFISLMKSAYSTNIKERHDHSSAVIDVRGRLVVQAEKSLAIHLGSMTGLIDSILDQYAIDEIKPGDMFVANDPYCAGGSHLPDVNLALPVFVAGELICFVCNIAHHADIGGMVPGSMAGGMSEIYQEGLRIPVVRLFSKGELVGDILKLLLLNARVPEERRGDYYAQISSCRLGARRVEEIVERFGRNQVVVSFDEIMKRTRSRVDNAIASLPAGTHVFEDVMDDDGLGTENIVIKLTLTIDPAAPRLMFDFTGTHSQVLGNINTTMNATRASVLYAVKALLDPDAPNNQGLIDAVEIFVPSGTLLNAEFPAAVAARANTCQRIVDVVIGGFVDVLPECVVGGANGANTTTVIAGVDPDTKRQYVYFETLGGGFGGRATKDGKDGVQVHITNTSNLPIEAIETEYPLIVERYEFAEDSGGQGRHRGGLGLRRVIKPVAHSAIFSGFGERFFNAPWGIFGGDEGRPGRFTLVSATGTSKRLISKPSGIVIAAGEAIVIETAGGGGYGPASERSPESIADDLESGKYTRG
ncbi:hydantoinase B/oxoprolinase family protein [Mesorhizobium ciceri]|uniref:hydantoinase B/oxoprolinase family protein n=1 Tax=Mesorhizobium TaxID=68287 RepID=UPI00067F1E7A|nr:hydantoinase B/oxoprolinase family protein [Mesorhizobium ciceri]